MGQMTTNKLSLNADTHQPLHSEGKEGTKGKDHPQDWTGDES